MEELEKIVNHAHKGCEHPNGRLSNLTIEEVKEMNEKYKKDCNYCPYNSSCEICSGVEDVIFHKMCYECNYCAKWTFPESVFI